MQIYKSWHSKIVLRLDAGRVKRVKYMKAFLLLAASILAFGHQAHAQGNSNGRNSSSNDKCVLSGQPALPVKTASDVSVQTSTYSCQGPKGQYFKTEQSFYRGGKLVLHHTLRRPAGMKLSSHPSSVVPVVSARNSFSTPVDSKFVPLFSVSHRSWISGVTAQISTMVRSAVSKIKSWVPGSGL